MTNENDEREEVDIGFDEHVAGGDEVIAPSAEDCSSRLLDNLPPAQEPARREDTLRLMIALRSELWLSLAQDPVAWQRLRERIVDAQNHQLGSLLERPVHADQVRLRAAVLSGIDRVIAGHTAELVHDTAQQIVPRHRTLLELVRQISTSSGSIAALVRRLKRQEDILLSGSMRLAAHIVRKCAPHMPAHQHEDLLQDALMGMQDAYRRLTPDAMVNTSAYVASHAEHRTRDGIARLRGIARRQSVADACPVFVNIDKKIEGTDLTVADTVCDGFEWDELDDELDLRVMRQSLGELPEVQRRVLSAAFQLNGQEPVKPLTVARGLGVPVQDVIDHARDGVMSLRRKMAA